MEELDSPSREMKAWAATAFLMDIFGGWHLSALVGIIILSRRLLVLLIFENQIGCLDFFDKLPSIVATEFGEQHTIPTALSSATHEEKGKKIHGCVQSIKATLNNEEWYLTFASKLKSKVFGVEVSSFCRFSSEKEPYSNWLQ